MLAKLLLSVRQTLCQLLPGIRCVRVPSMDRVLLCVMGQYNDPSRASCPPFLPFTQPVAEAVVTGKAESLPTRKPNFP